MTVIDPMRQQKKDAINSGQPVPDANQYIQSTSTGTNQPPLYVPPSPPAGGSTAGVPYPTPTEINNTPPALPEMPDPTKQAPAPVPQTPDLGLFPTGGANQDTSYQDVAAKAPGVTPEQTVAGQLQELFKEGNPLLEHARKLGQLYAGERGLQNSSIAAQAGAEALYQTALPIAQQDANTFAARSQQEAQFWQNAGLQAQNHVQNLVEMARQGDINSRLQLEQFGYNWELNEQQNLHNMQLSALQGDIQARLALQQFGFDTQLMENDYNYRMQLQDIELRNALALSGQEHEQLSERIMLQHQNTLEEIAANVDATTVRDAEQFARNLQQNYLNATERRTLQFSQEVTTIYSQQGLSASQQRNAVNVARQNYLNDLNNLREFYSRSPYWDDSWGVAPGGTPGDFPGDAPPTAGGDGTATGGGFTSPPVGQPPPPPPGAGGYPPAGRDYTRQDDRTLPRR